MKMLSRRRAIAAVAVGAGMAGTASAGAAESATGERSVQFGGYVAIVKGKATVVSRFGQKFEVGVAKDGSYEIEFASPHPQGKLPLVVVTPAGPTRRGTPGGLLTEVYAPVAVVRAVSRQLVVVEVVRIVLGEKQSRVEMAEVGFHFLVTVPD